MSREDATAMGLVAPLGDVTQFAGNRLSVSCNTKPGVLGVHESMAKPGPARAITSVGAPAVCTAVGSAQNPLVTENCPLVIGPPASGWPMVPTTEWRVKFGANTPRLESAVQCWRAESVPSADLEIAYDGQATTARIFWRRLDDDKYDTQKSVGLDLASDGSAHRRLFYGCNGG